MPPSAERKRAPVDLDLATTEAVIALRAAVREVSEASRAWSSKDPKSAVQAQSERDRHRSAIRLRERARKDLERLLEEDA